MACHDESIEFALVFAYKLNHAAGCFEIVLIGRHEWRRTGNGNSSDVQIVPCEGDGVRRDRCRHLDTSIGIDYQDLEPFHPYHTPLLPDPGPNQGSRSSGGRYAAGLGGLALLALVPLAVRRWR